MRTGLITIVALTAALTGVSAQAGQYTGSIEGCQKAIGERLGIDGEPTNYNIEKVRTRSRHRDLSFSVSVYDQDSPVQGVDVQCRTDRTGEVLALEFDDASLPNALATQ